MTLYHDSRTSRGGSMDARTLDALKGSIAKWQAIVDGTGVDKGADNCPLCLLFYDDWCTCCPVMERTGKAWCRGTPYQKYVHGVSDGRDAALADLAFLKSLLPEGETA